MGRWDQFAADLLDAATSAGVTVARSFITPSSNYAKRCRLLAVRMAGVPTTELPVPGDFGMPCATVTRLGLVVDFVADCYPPPGDDGSPPDAGAVTAWTRLFMADAERIHGALLGDWWSDPTVACDGVTVGAGETFGPTGGHARISWPVAVLLT